MIIAAILSFLGTILFPGMEVAMKASNKVQIELEEKQGSKIAALLLFFLRKPTWFTGTTQIGHIISLVSFAALSTQLVLPGIVNKLPDLFSPWVVFVLLSLLLTLLLMYTSDFLSKTLFLLNSNLILNWFAVPFTILSALMFPVVFVVLSVARGIAVYILKLPYSFDKPVFGLTDIQLYLQTVATPVQEKEDVQMDKKIFSNVLEFKSVRIFECMIPRTEIVGIPLQSTIAELQQKFIESGHSKIVVYKDSIDEVVGYCHSSALFNKPTELEEILTPIITVPESMLANEVMVRLISEQKSLAIAVDEFGGTSGLVSMEDIIEEIFGEIEDEHDKPELIEQQVNEQSYIFSARLEIDYLNEKYAWDLPTGEYETLGGLVLSVTEDIPAPGETINLPPYTLRVQTTDAKRINTVLLTVDRKSPEYL